MHLHDLGNGWGLWRWFLLRGAGFPADEVLRLASSDTARALDRLHDREAALADLRAQVHQRLRELFAADQVEARPRRQAMRRLYAGAPAEGAPISPAVDALLATVAAAAVEVETARREAERCFAADQARVGEELRAIARDDRFREAVTWQNAQAVHTALDALVRKPPGTDNAPLRQHRRLVASYLQRYCVKADTIGFFGPGSWGDIAGEGERILVRPGPALLADRRVYFEGWAIDALARRLAERDGMRPHLAPRRHPTVRGGEGLSAAAERLLEACDGERSARELLRALDLPEDEGLRLLGELATGGLVIWTLEVPVNLEHPERALAEVLRAIDGPELRDPALAAVAELEAARAGVCAAAGSPAALDAALAAMATTFEGLTGAAATRHAGRTYAGRTLVYEDCTRDLAITLGPALVARLQQPLALVLDSARWYSYTVAERYRAAFRETFDRLRGAAHEVDYPAFLRAVEPYFTGGAMAQPGGSAPLLQSVLEELSRRWGDVLGLAPEAREQRFRTSELAPRAAAAFSAPHSGAAHIRYHCPDLMIAAASVDAIARGELHFVLSELHTGWHTFATPVPLGSCPDPQRIIAARARDLSRFEIVPVLGRERYIRGFPVTFGADDIHVELADGRSSQPRTQVLAAADLVVREVGSELQVHHRRDARAFDILDFHVFFVNRSTNNQFSLMPPLAHTPRIWIDDLVIARECWRMTRAEIPFLDATSSFDRLAGARHWLRAHGLPRCVFVKLAEEKKPFYVDLESAIYIDLFANKAKHSSHVTVTEMLPDHAQTWLPDRLGNRYVCELRVAVLDGATAGSTAASRSSQT